jgi:hypothetical protein
MQKIIGERNSDAKFDSSFGSETIEQTSMISEGVYDLLKKINFLPRLTNEDIRAKRFSDLALLGKNTTAQVRRLLGFAFWSEARCLCTPDVRHLVPKRSLEKLQAIDSGEFFSKKLERMVRYRSGLEGAFFCMLEHSQDVLWYLEQPVSVRYLKEKEPSFHVPDVLVCLGHDKFVVAEIKPVGAMLGHSNVDKYLALRGYCGALGWGLLLTDGKYAFTELAEHKLKSDYAAEIRARLHVGPLSYGEYKEIEKVYGASKLDFAAVIMQQEIEYTTKPFQLKRKAVSNNAKVHQARVLRPASGGRDT